MKVRFSLSNSLHDALATTWTPSGALDFTRDTHVLQCTSHGWSWTLDTGVRDGNTRTAAVTVATPLCEATSRRFVTRRRHDSFIITRQLSLATSLMIQKYLQSAVRLLQPDTRTTQELARETDVDGNVNTSPPPPLTNFIIPSRSSST